MRLVAALLLGLLVLTAPAYASNAPSTYDRVIQSGTIRCGWGTWMPFISKDLSTGKMIGLYVDILEEMATRLSLKVEWPEESPVSTLVEGIATHRYDMGCVALTINAARGRVVAYTQPLLYSPLYLAVRADDARFDYQANLLNAAGMNVAVQDGEISAIVARQQFPLARHVSIAPMAEYGQLFLEVSAGKADAAIVVRADLDTFMKANPGALKSLEPPVTQLALAFPLPKDFAFTSMVSAAITEMQMDGTIDRIFARYPETVPYYQLPAVPLRPISP